MDASILIPTLDRWEELCRSIDSCLEQHGNIEVIVICDGSPPEIPRKLRETYPEIVVLEYRETGGCGLRRTDGGRVAQGQFLFSIDDDAVFTSPTTVQDIIAQFSEPWIGAVAIPYTNVNQDGATYQQALDNQNLYLSERYRGTAFALRREVFDALDGFCPHISHQGEEGDFCIRMLEKGYYVRLGACEPIHHYESIRRDFTFMDRNGRRNDVLFVWKNVPLPYMLWHLPATILKGLLFVLRVGRLRNMLAGYKEAWNWIRQGRVARRPVASETYRTSRYLKQHDCVTKEQLASILSKESE